MLLDVWDGLNEAFFGFALIHVSLLTFFVGDLIPNSLRLFAWLTVGGGGLVLAHRIFLSTNGSVHENTKENEELLSNETEICIEENNEDESLEAETQG